MRENNRKDFEAEEDIYKDAPGLDPNLEWVEESDYAYLLDSKGEHERTVALTEKHEKT